MTSRRLLSLAGLLALVGSSNMLAADPPPGPAYQIVLRSRVGEAAPSTTKDAQTGGGSVIVEQPEPHTIVVTMGGSAVAGSDYHGSSAAIAFNLEQDLDILPTRTGVRPPRVGMVGRVLGTLNVTDPGKCGKSCGSADQGPATASLIAGDSSILNINVKTATVATAQQLAINYRDGPVESVASAGCYRLVGSFRVGVNQGRGVCHRQYAVADFDPAPQLDAFWADALKPFRAVPRKEFGFKVVLRVVEDAGQ